MALSGSTSKTYTPKGAYWIWVEWSATQSITGNYSDVVAHLYMGTNSYGFVNFTKANKASITIDGTRTYFTTVLVPKNTTKKLIGSASKRVSHDSDGTRSFGLSGWYHHDMSSTNFQLTIPTKTETLNTIPRYANITSYTITDIRLDRFTLNYNSDKTIKEAQYRIYNIDGSVFRNWTVFNNNTWKGNLTPGTSYDVVISIQNSQSDLWTTSAKKRITTLRLSTGTIVNRNVHAGNPIILNISRTNSNITHNVTMQVGIDNNTFMNLKTVNGVGTSVDLTLNQAERDLYYQNRKLGKTSNYRVLIRSIWDREKGSVYSNTAVLTMTDNEVIPTLSGITYRDINTAVQGVLGNDQKILRNMSDVRFTAGTASPKKWATIKSYNIRFNGNTFAKNSAEITGVYVDTGKVDANKATTATMTVTDSRGFAVSRNITVDILGYVKPQFIYNKVVRENNYEEPSYLVTQNRRTVVKPVNTDINTLNLRYRYKNTNTGTYGDWVNITTANANTEGIYQNVTTNQYIGDFPNDQSYNVQVQIKDNFTDWQTTTLLLSEGISLQQYQKDKIIFGVPLFDKKTGEKYITSGDLLDIPVDPDPPVEGSGYWTSIIQYGAIGNGSTDDTTAFEDALLEITNLVIPEGTYKITRPLNVRLHNSNIIFHRDAKIEFYSSDFDARFLTINANNSVVNLCKVETKERRKFVVSLLGENSRLEGGSIYYRTKSTMSPVPETSIYYHRGGIELSGSHNEINGTEVYNMEGAGLCLYGNYNKVYNSNLHDNCNGILLQTPHNGIVKNNHINFNDVRHDEGFSGIIGWSHGLMFDGNTLIGNGEHGTYIKGTNATIINNYVKNTYKNGIKISNMDGCIISNNKLEDNNTYLNPSEGQIYCQNDIKNVVISSNIEISGLTKYFLRSYSKVETKNLKIVDNTFIGDIMVHVQEGLIVDNNSTQGTLAIGFPDSSYPVCKNAIISNNSAKSIVVNMFNDSIFQNNTFEDFSVGFTLRLELIHNKITWQTSQIRIDSVTKFNNNTINFRGTSGTLFEQITSKTTDNKIFEGNIFNSRGGRFLFFTTADISSDNLTILNNIFTGALQPLYFWGEGHLISGNRCDQSMGYLGCNNSIITQNFSAPSLRSGLTGNIVANNK